MAAKAVPRPAPLVAGLKGNITMDFFKGLIPGTILTLIVTAILGSNHFKSGYLYIFHQYIAGFGFYWSWPMFVASTLLAWAIFAMSPK